MLTLTENCQYNTFVTHDLNTALDYEVEMFSKFTAFEDVLVAWNDVDFYAIY
jgi:hypothetical protein